MCRATFEPPKIIDGKAYIELRATTVLASINSTRFPLIYSLKFLGFFRAGVFNRIKRERKGGDSVGLPAGAPYQNNILVSTK